MTLKEMFRKVEAHNEIAVMMGNDLACISLCDKAHHVWLYGDKFTAYKPFAAWIRREYIKEVADWILRFDGFEFDKEIENDMGHGVHAYEVHLLRHW